jgi:putative Mn2+ efflux pump MntP
MRADNDPLAVAARAAFIVTVAAIAFASLTPAGWMPRVLYSYHLEHFAAFYLVALSMAAARYRTNIYRLLLDAGVLATVLEAIRLLIPSHQLSVVEDWASDIGGILAALTPIVVGDFRKSFLAPPSTDEPDVASD